MRFFLWAIVAITAINIFVTGLNIYVLNITLNSYGYDKSEKQLPDYPETTEEQEDWIKINAPLIEVDNMP